MQETLLKYTYLPDFSRSTEGPAVKALFAVPCLLVEAWAFIVAYLATVFFQSTVVGVIACVLATILFQTKWTAFGAHRDGVTFVGLVLTGIISALAVYAAGETNQALCILGWGVTGAFSLRFYSWFWGPPMVFENRTFGEVLTFILGPFYWLIVVFFAAIILIGSGVTHVIERLKSS